MDESEFQQLLEHFPVVRSRDYHADLNSLTQTNQPAENKEVKEWQDAWDNEDKREAFWRKLKVAAEQKVGADDAEIFCNAFQQVYKKLVYKELTLDAARRVTSSRTS